MLKINENNEIEVYNVIPVFRDNRIIKFITSVSIADINMIYDRLRYDEETQRGFKDIKNKKGNVVAQQQIFNKHNVQEITEKIVNHQFLDGDILTWNCRLKSLADTESYEYIPEELMIKIKNEFLTIPDSSQRHLAIHNLKNYNVSINPKTFNFPLQICLYTLKEEQSLFSEVNALGSRASKSRALYLSNTFKTLLTKDIINNSKLHNNVETKSIVTIYSDKVIGFATLYNSLFEHGKGAFRDLRDDEVTQFRDWMIKFWDFLIEVRPELGILSKEERMELKRKSIIDSSMVMYSFAFVAKALWHDTNWKRRLSRLGHDYEYKCGLWTGDLFSLDNVKWMGTVCVQNKHGEWKVNNSRRSVDFIVDTLLKYLNLIKI
jgi:hypothetical protein